MSTELSPAGAQVALIADQLTLTDWVKLIAASKQPQIVCSNLMMELGWYAPVMICVNDLLDDLSPDGSWSEEAEGIEVTWEDADRAAHAVENWDWSNYSSEIHSQAREVAIDNARGRLGITQEVSDD